MQEYKMAKSITFFDKEHTGGINLAAMEDTQLKENLVQDIATGGTEAPTATAVKEAVDAKMGRADIINDLTTGGADKVLSAEQGKVLDGKKVDKVVTPDSVYVTEGSKPLSDFAMKADIINDLTTGGTDKALSAEQGKALEGKKVDKVSTPASVYVTEGSKPLSDFAMKADIVNDLTTGGTDKALSAEQGKVLEGMKVDKIVTPDSVYTTNGGKPLADFAMKAEVTLSGTGETFISMPNLNGFNTDKGISSSIFFVHPSDLANISESLKAGDIVSFKPTVEGIKGNVTAVFSHITTELTPNDDHILNETDNGFTGWYAFTILSSDYDRVQMSNKTQSFNVRLQANSETVNSMYDLSDSAAPNSRCAFYVKPADIASLKLRRGDTVTFSPAAGKGTIVAIYETLANVSHTISKQPCLNKTNPASGNFGGWYIFNVVSSDYDRTHGTASQRTYAVTYGAELPLGLRRGYNIILKPNSVLTDLLPSLRYGDIVELTNTNKDYVYTAKFIRLCNSEDNKPKIRDEHVVGQDIIPDDVIGWFIFSIVGAVTDVSNMPVELTTARYQASQFTVGTVYKIKYELSGNDSMFIPHNPNIVANKFTANKLAIYEALLSTGLIRLKTDNGTMYVNLNLVRVDFEAGNYTLYGICISKGAAAVTNLTGA